METQTQKAVALWKNGQIKDALKIFKGFKIGVSQQEKQTLEIAYECLSGQEAFYQSIGIETQQIKQNAIGLINNKYINK